MSGTMDGYHVSVMKRFPAGRSRLKGQYHTSMCQSFKTDQRQISGESHRPELPTNPATLRPVHITHNPRLRRKPSKRTEHRAEVQGFLMGSCWSFHSPLHWANDSRYLEKSRTSSQSQIPMHGGSGQIGMLFLLMVNGKPLISHSPMAITGHLLS